MRDRSLPWSLPAALAVYALYAGATTWTLRNWIHPDAVAYLRHARYVVEGRWTDALAGYWSPLLIWTTAPFVAAGIDPLYAARIPLFLGGAGVVAASWVLARRLAPLPRGIAFVASLFVAEVAARWAAVVFPDLLLACFLLAAFAVLASPEFLERPVLQACSGMLGGLAFLGKAYGFPFFVVSLPVGLVLLHGGDVRKRRTMLPRAWALSMLGFVLVAAPWIGALSWKYGRLTWGTSAAINHAVTRYAGPYVTTLHNPGPGRVTIWETPEAIPFRYWSPWESREAAEFQAAYAWRTAKTIRDSLARFDAAGLSIVLVFGGPLVLLALGDHRELRRSAWIAAVAAIYCSGFLFVYFTYRYVEPFLKPLCLLACFGVASSLAARIEAGAWPSPAAARGLGRAAIGAVLLSFALHVGVPFEPHRIHEPDGTRFNDVTVDSRPHRALADGIREHGLVGPLASDLYWAGMYVSYFVGETYAGSPAEEEDLAAFEAGLVRTGVRTLLLDRSGRFTEAFATNPEWSRAFSMESAGTTVDVYAAR